MTTSGGILVLANIQRHWDRGPRKSTFWNATETMNPSMMPNAVHICHIMVNAPLIDLGAHSELKTGVVDDFAPTANPKQNRAMRRFGQDLATAIQIPVTKETKQEMKMVPLLPNHLFSGAFVQHPMRAEQR